MYRVTPVWYLDGLNEVHQNFSKLMSQGRPRNLLLMSSFPNPALEADGVHLTPFSGLEYVVYLFDKSLELVKSQKDSPEAFVLAHTESIRGLEDRVVVLEQDHRRLNRQVEDKSAVDAELHDFDENKRNEDQFLITGLPRIRTGLTTKEWQTQVQQDVRGVVSLLLNREPSIKVVHNQTGTKKATSYLVKMEDSRDASAIRSAFGSFFKGGKDARPAALNGISITNWVTPATKVRIAILKVLATRYRSSNPGSKVQVVGYESRPLLRLTPPPEASDRRTKIYNYIEAIRSLPTNFTPAELELIMSKVSPRLNKDLRSVFSVLNDDIPKVNRPARPATNSEVAQGQEEPREGSSTSTASTDRGGKRPNPSPVGHSSKTSKTSKSSRK